MEPAEAVEILAQGIRKTSRPSNYSIAEANEVSDQLRAALIAIPGHADYLAKKISLARERRGETGGEGSYDNTRVWTIQGMAYIPTPEIVRVLGEFLADEEEPPHDPSDIDSPRPGSNAYLAVNSLRKLIEEPPVGKDRNYQMIGDISEWQQWYEQLKSGTATFRFKGDSKEYDLGGVASVEKLKQIADSHKRDTERATGQRKSAAVSPESGSSKEKFASGTGLAGILAGTAGVVALWYFLGKKGWKTQ